MASNWRVISTQIGRRPALRRTSTNTHHLTQRREVHVTGVITAACNLRLGRLDTDRNRRCQRRRARIEVKAGDFRDTRYLSEKQQAKIKRTNLLTGDGEAEYAFRIPQTGWYELWVEACTWSTDLLMDGRLLTHTTFTGGEWKPDHNAEKVLNVYLAAGDHTLRFVRPWPRGLPYMRRFFFEPARDATGMVRLAPKKDYMVFRRGEEFPMQLQAGRLAAA